MSANFWVFVSFLGFVGVLLYVGVPRRVGALLDTRRQGIVQALEEAQTLREEAATLLESCEAQRRGAQKEAEQLLRQVQEDSERWAQERRENVRRRLAFQTEAAQQSLARAEEHAKQEVRLKAQQMAVQMAQDWLLKHLPPKDRAALTQTSLSALIDVVGEKSSSLRGLPTSR